MKLAPKSRKISLLSKGCALALAAFLFSCSDTLQNPNAFNGVPLSGDELAATAVGKWNFEGSSPYLFLELKENGTYILAETSPAAAGKTAAGKSTAPNTLAKDAAETLLGTVHIGTYSFSGQNITLENFGTIAGITFDAQNFKISFVLSGNSYIAGGTAAYSGSKTDSLCKPWILKKVAATFGDAGGDAAINDNVPKNLTAMWSKGGTYMVIYDNPDGKQTLKSVGLSEWEWGEGETSFYYSWTNWESGSKASGTPFKVEMIYLSADSLVLKEDKNYYFFSLLKPSVSVSGNPILGQSLTASVDMPALVGEECAIKWVRNNIDTVSTGESYALQKADGGNSLKAVALCGKSEETYGSYSATASTSTQSVAPPKPEITVHPAGADYLISETPSELSVTATCYGGATCNYQWKKGNENVGANSSTYTPTLEYGSQNYSVVVSVTIGETSEVTSSAAAIRVPNVPSIGLENKTCNYGFTCTLSPIIGGNATRTYQWSNADGDIGGATALTYNAPSGEIGTKSYTITAKNAFGAKFESASKTVEVTIELSAPAITTQPASKQCETGGTCALSVSATGSGTLSYQWYKENGETDEAVGTNSATFDVPVTEAGERDYYVVVKSTVGDAEKTTASSVANVKVWASLLQCSPLSGKSKSGVEIPNPLSCSKNAELGENITWNPALDLSNPAAGTYSSITATASCGTEEQTVSCGSIQIVPACAYQASWCNNIAFESVTKGSIPAESANDPRCFFASAISENVSNQWNTNCNGTQLGSSVSNCKGTQDGGYYLYTPGYNSFNANYFTAGTPACLP